MSPDPTCQQRIGAHMESREEDIAALYVLVDNETDDTYAEGLEGLESLPLSIESHLVVKILLSWGGPSDFIEVIVNELTPNARHMSQYEILSATYHFQDWFDGASMPISEDSAMWRYVTDTVEGYMEGGR